MKKLIFIFILAFLYNFVWEHLHSNLYVHYKGGEITDLILLKAAIFDAFVITLLALIFLRKKIKILLPVIIALAFAILLERWALSTGRWAYNDLMPIIPIIGTGLTPTIQLALLFIFSVKLSEMSFLKKYI